MGDSLMDRQVHLFGVGDISLDTSLLRTKVARVLAGLGVGSYRLGLVLAALVLVVDGAFVALLTEPLAYRLMTLVFLGIIPAIALYVTGWMLSWIMRIICAVCDFSIMLLYPKYQILADTLVSAWHLVVCFTKYVVRRCVTTLKAFLRACHCCLRRIVAAAAAFSAITVRGSIDAYRYFFMVATFATRLAARLLIAVLPQEFSAT